MTREIPLTQGKVALVDDDVYEWASRHKWYAHRCRSTFYVQRMKGTRPFTKTTSLHREILNAPQGVPVDHINGDGLDCRRANLRLATIAENNRNTRRRKDNTSGFKGVSLHKDTGKWEAYVSADGRRHYLGLFITPEEAHRAYDEAARKYHGEFARTNEGETP